MGLQRVRHDWATSLLLSLKVPQWLHVRYLHGAPSGCPALHDGVSCVSALIFHCSPLALSTPVTQTFFLAHELLRCTPIEDIWTCLLPLLQHPSSKYPLGSPPPSSPLSPFFHFLSLLFFLFPSSFPTYFFFPMAFIAIRYILFSLCLFSLY